MSDLTTLTPVGLAARARARDYAAEALSRNTQRAYRADWADFCAWCAAAGAVPVPADPADIAAYLASLATTHAPATLQRRLAAIGQMHKLAGHDWRPGHPAIRATLRGLLRSHGRPQRKAAAITVDLVKRLVSTCDASARGTRDRALLLLGFAGALRRSELAGLRLEDVRPVGTGLRLLIVGSKTDPTRQGQEVGIPRGTVAEHCPVRAWEAWRALLPVRTGPAFRKVSKGGRILDRALWPEAVRCILLARAARAGLAIADVAFSPHGLRAGWITEAYRRGARDDQVMPHTRHRDLKTLKGYVRPAKLLDDTPDVGL